ncbi:MAG: cyclomaltodextrinase C-terminal domain-containing protein [Hymenobacter sp.]
MLLRPPAAPRPSRRCLPTCAPWPTTAKPTRCFRPASFTHFVPEDGVYTYFRHNAGGQAVMVMLNTNAVAKQMPLGRFAERLHGYTTAQDVLTGAIIPRLQVASLPAYTAPVWELR